ncbi:MAG: transcription antitermination factor NusB [Clostridia bacterium]|nr:transcription antitermination factor NusB [Clostridia bacterium]
MNRRKSREQALCLLFENTFGLQDMNEIILNAKDIREEDISEFSEQIFKGVLENLEKIDRYIEKNLNGWTKERISKTSISILRMAIFEILFCDDIPNSVSINEAVELAKKYSTKKEASYINGLLGSVNKDLNLIGK